MKKKIFYILLVIPLTLLVFVLSLYKVMMPSDYIKAKEMIIEDCSKLNLHGKVTITGLYSTNFQLSTYTVSYIYSEETYDGQTIKLEQNERSLDEDLSYSDFHGSAQFLEYKESFLEQKSVQKVEKKIEEQLKKQKLGLPISSFSFFPNRNYRNRNEREKILDTIASNNLKEGKKDFAGYYQIPYQALIDKELIRMVIYIDDDASVKSQDLKDAAKKLDASNLPNGEYSFYQYNFEDGPNNSVDYNFKVKDGKVVFYEDENLVLEDDD